MKKLLGLSLLFAVSQPSLLAVQVGNNLAQVQLEKGRPPGKMVAGGFIILSYPDQTVWMRDDRVLRLSGPPRRISVVPAPRPKPKPRPVPAWKEDLDAAFAQAREQNQHVLLFFTGTGWGPRGELLEKEVLTSPEFVDYANENLVLVKIDFPKVAAPRAEGDLEDPANAEQPPARPVTRAQAAKLAKADDCPLIFVLDSDGRPAGSFGYAGTGAGPFIDALKRL